MSEIKKVEIETEETQPPQQPSLPETNIQMAIAYGQMTETNKRLLEEMQTDRAERNQTTAMLNEALTEIRELRSRQDTTLLQTEQLKESLTDTISTMTEDSENDAGVMDVTPLMETKIETKIEQKPAGTGWKLPKWLF